MTDASKRWKKKQPSFILGRTAMEKNSAVEGIVYSDEMKREFAEFDRDGLSHEDRERAILRRYEKKC